MIVFFIFQSVLNFLAYRIKIIGPRRLIRLGHMVHGPVSAYESEVVRFIIKSTSYVLIGGLL